MANKCAGCKRFISTQNGIRCTGCNSVYHYACVGLPEGAKMAVAWRCPECKVKVPRQSNNAGTPVRSVASDCEGSQSPPTVEDHGSAYHTANCSSGADITIELQLFREEMRATRLEMMEFRSTIAALAVTVTACNSRLDSLETRLELVEQQLKEPKQNEVETLERIVVELRQDINDREQELLLNDLEITGVPEEQQESLGHIVASVALKLNCKLDERDIVNVERVGPLRGHVEGEGRPRPRPIALRLARRVCRDTLLKGARVRRGATTEDMGLPGAPRRFYVNERLTRANRRLFAKAREASHIAKWRYVWTRDGKIYVRRDHGTERQRLRGEDDLARVFGPVVVGSA